MKLFLLIVTAIFVTGCATDKELTMAYRAQSEVVKAQANIVQKPLFEISCGTDKDSCKGLTFKYTPERQNIEIPRVRTTNDMITEIAPEVVKAVGYGVTGYAAVRVTGSVVSAMGGRNVTSNNIVNGTNNTTNPAITKSEIDGVTTDNQNNSVDNSAVATPTIVDQPTPTIVEQPTPTIVNPTVVEQQVVKPEIITVP